MMIHRLDERVFVAGQIRPGDMAEIAALGVATIVNNRPDGEEPGQPAGNEIAAAAAAADLGYREVLVAGTIAPAQVEAMAAIAEQCPGRLLLYCRSGQRSASLWAMTPR
jgi:uncharacterized protein (TIGR01244 family)